MALISARVAGVVFMLKYGDVFTLLIFWFEAFSYASSMDDICWHSSTDA